jgi:phenylalanyl-tRNA synthetase beta chain
VPNLLRALARNRATAALDLDLSEVRLCEWTRVFPPGGEEVRVVGLARAELVPPGASRRVFLSLVEDVRLLLDRLGIDDVAVEDAGDATLHGALPPPPFLHPGRRAVVSAGGTVLALLGEVHPAVGRDWTLEPFEVAVGEVNLDRVLAHGRRGPAYRPVPRFPAAPFDVSVIVPRRTPAAAVASAISDAAPEVRAVSLFDVYEGTGIPAGHRSLAFRMRFVDEAGTPTPEALARLQGRVLGALRGEGWTVRTADTVPPPA